MHMYMYMYMYVCCMYMYGRSIDGNADSLHPMILLLLDNEVSCGQASEVNQLGVARNRQDCRHH